MPEQEKVRLEYCPKCKLRSLFWNQTMQIWECLNPECRRVYTPEELSEYQNKQQPNKSRVAQPTRERKTQQISFDAPLWLVNILESKRFWKLLICTAVIWWCWTAIQYSGKSIGLAFGLAIPILLLYAVRIILRKFLTGYNGLASQHRLSQIFYSIRKSSFLRFVIILATIALLVTTIWSMVAFIYQLTVASSAHLYLLNMLIIIIAQIWLLSWLCGMLKRSRQLSSKPKFAVVFWSLLAVAVFCAFVGISPFSDIKNTTTTAIANWWEQTTIATPTPAEPPAERPIIPPNTSAEVPNPPPAIGYDTNIERYPNRVWVNENTYLMSSTGRATELYENTNAKNPTWDQLLSFLRTDNTDKMTYVPNQFVCVDFAETLHNNAERSGIRCGLVILYEIQHASNAFETVDKGLVFIDCTGLRRYETGPGSEDKIVNVQLGADYIPRYIFSNQIGNTVWTLLSMGTVTRYQICWKAGEVLDYQYDYDSIAYVPPSYVPPSDCEERCADHHGQWYNLCIDNCMKETEYVPPPPSDCEERCAKYQGVWHNGCIDDCMKGGTDKWSWK